MEAFAALLDKLVLTPQRNAKLRAMTDYFRATPDPDRGHALAALTGDLVIPSVKPAMLRDLAISRLDEILFAYSYDYVGDLAETIALVWQPKSANPPRPPIGTLDESGVLIGEDGVILDAPKIVSPASPARALPARRARSAINEAASPAPVSLPFQETLDLPLPPSPTMARANGDTAPPASPPLPQEPARGLGSGGQSTASPSLGEVVERLQRASQTEGLRLVEAWLDELDATGRWGLIKLVAGGLRVGVSARLAKQALADLGGKGIQEIEELWHGLASPYVELFAWLEGSGERPTSRVTAPFRPVMLSHAIDDSELGLITPEAYAAEWKWDGIRVQAVNEGGVKRLYSRTGDDISGAFPDLVRGLTFQGAIDGELLVGRKGDLDFIAGSFSDLQQRLNRKAVSEKILEEFPAFIRAYDLLVDDGEDLRPLAFRERRRRLETLVARGASDRLDLSPLLAFGSGEELAALRLAPPEPLIEGLMLKRWDSVYEAGRPKGPWFKWKRDPHVIDAVLMYAQRGHGKRSSYYSDYTFGVWQETPEGDELVPVGKAYFGFTDEELIELDRYVRNNTVSRFGPVREVAHERAKGLVLEIAFEGLARSTRHRSGVAMRFPRISRLRWDKPPSEADRLETLEKLIRA